MTVRSTFTASGIQTAETLRRALTNALSSLAGQINQDINATNAKQTTGITLPTTGTIGYVFVLTSDDGSNTAGVYFYNGTNWVRS